MKPQVKTNTGDTIEAVQATLKAGGVVLLPTETVYGLACRADNADAIKRIYDIKGRDFDKTLAVCVSGVSQAVQLAEFSHTAKSLAINFWPGPLTLVLPAKKKTLNNQCYLGETIALRCPDVDWRVILPTTPLALTSANKSGEPDAIDANIDLPVDRIFDQGPSRRHRPSTILAVTGEKIKLLRAGALGSEELASYEVDLL